MSNAVLVGSRVFASTDGLDKFLKTVIGAFTVLGTTQSPQHETFSNAAEHFTEVRSFLRLGRLLGLTLKIRSLTELFAAQGLVWTERKKFVEFLKSICDFAYAVGDHLRLLAREGLLGKNVNTTRLNFYTVTAQLCSHVLSAIFNILELRDAVGKLEYDPPAAQCACKNAAIEITRDVFDSMVAGSLLGCAGAKLRLRPRVSGILTCASGGLSSYLNWQRSA